MTVNNPGGVEWAVMEMGWVDREGCVSYSRTPSLIIYLYTVLG